MEKELDCTSNLDENINKLEKLKEYDNKINKVMNSIIPGLIRYALSI